MDPPHNPPPTTATCHGNIPAVALVPPMMRTELAPQHAHTISATNKDPVIVRFFMLFCLCEGYR